MRMFGNDEDDGWLDPVDPRRVKDPPFYDNIPFPNPNGEYNVDYDCCIGCGNNPRNGGSGICHCTLPYQGMITY